ncbi:MAG: SAM-dependent methyltransferase [Planctomycetota bacterium]|jgi:23S rRNA (cytidine1920-2'-O)/16S rRNA (cytidine1409-2'-O)-methyltransferase
MAAKPESEPEPAPPLVSRGGLKLEHALRVFEVDVAGLICADFGCHVGGFTDCLLRHGAATVFAVDTGYGILDYRLRTDPRVVVMERTNVLHADPPREAALEAPGGRSESDPASGGGGGGVDLVAIDLGWTRQRRAIPAALRWLKPGGRIISLIKPHYELEAHEKNLLSAGGLLAHAHAERVFRRVLSELPGLGLDVLTTAVSPIPGAKSARKHKADPHLAGNREYLVLAERVVSRGANGPPSTPP